MTTVTITHHQGSGDVEDFHHIEEVNGPHADEVGAPTLRVFYEEEQVANPATMQYSSAEDLYYEEYHMATVTEVWPNGRDDDDGEGGGGLITVDP